MKLKVQHVYKYFYEADKQGSDVKIERILKGTAYATSEEFGGMGPFTMTFKVDGGIGTGDYHGTHLEEYRHGEMSSSEYKVTFRHSLRHAIEKTVLVKVTKTEDFKTEALRAANAVGIRFGFNEFIQDPSSWKLIN